VNKAIPIAILALFCASAGHAECGADEFRGFGTGAGEGEALNAAYSSLARQIHSSVKVSEKYTQSQKVTDGDERLNSEYASKTLVESSLSNAHDARVLRVERGANGASATVCMSRSNAAKGFAARQRLVADSLEVAANAALGAKHPKHKNEAWQRTSALWSEFSRLHGMLDGLGAAKAGLFDSASAIYSKTRENRLNYCKTQKVYWKDAGNDCSKAVFAELSKSIKIEKSSCSNGLKLLFSCPEKCKSSSFGVECTLEPSLSVESCGGEPYSLLKSKKDITGSDMNSENRAREKLMANLSSAVFLKEWEREIKEWVPQCAD